MQGSCGRPLQPRQESDEGMAEGVETPASEMPKVRTFRRRLSKAFKCRAGAATRRRGSAVQGAERKSQPIAAGMRCQAMGGCETGGALERRDESWLM